MKNPRTYPPRLPLPRISIAAGVVLCLAGSLAYADEARLPTQRQQSIGESDGAAAGAQAKRRASQRRGAALEAEYESRIAPFLAKHCGDCHGPDYAEADVNFAAYPTVESLSKDYARWNQALGLLKLGVMPPPDNEPQPSMEERLAVAQWLDQALNYVDCDAVDDPGRVTIRRLNAAEYDNTLRDLLRIDFKPSVLAGFPSDEVGNGFDNQSDVLSLPPLLLEKYLSAAEEVVARAIVLDREALREQQIEEQTLFLGDTRGGDFLFAEGAYRLEFVLDFDARRSDKARAALLFDDRVLEMVEAGTREETFEVELAATAGRHRVAVRFAEDPGRGLRDGAYERRLQLEELTVRGPAEGPPALPESHLQIVRSRPSEDKLIAEAAEENLAPLVAAAYRRPADPLEIARLVNLVEMAVDGGESFEAAMGYALQAVLVSPHFLFRVERVYHDATDYREPLRDFELASRLSYFLWSSMPDDELFGLAASGQLSDADRLAEQARRMLRSDKVEALIANFFGQWLGLRNLAEIEPDVERYPMWNDRLRHAAARETELVCLEIVRSDRSILDLLDAEFTYVNPRMAELYDLEFEGQQPIQLYRPRLGERFSPFSQVRSGSYDEEDHWVRVALPPNRRGILTHASILTLTSNPTETSPVKRGKWVLENILGEPPPPAPPNVPDLEETKKANRELSLREQLAIHRQNASCASCHRVMDPIGLGFENFDVIGRWRTRDGRHTIDASSELADGQRFDGAVELVSLLVDREEAIARNFVEKLLTYAIGRGLTPADRCAVDEIVEAARREEYRISALVVAVVSSDPFRMRRATGGEP